MLESFKRLVNKVVNGDDERAAQQVMVAPAPPVRPTRTAIADIEYMGPTAVATLTVTEIAGDYGSTMLEELLADLVGSGAQHFVLDLQNVAHMDSRCLGALVEATNSLASRGGRIALVNPANTVQYVFRLTKLDRVFPICQDVLAAIAAVERHHVTGR
jgi:anti-sigma B factor antagonist